jgi:hypothetical protein
MNRNWLSSTCLCIGLALPASAALEFTNVTGIPPNLTAGLNAAVFDGANGFVAVGDNSVVLTGTFAPNTTTGLSWVSNAVSGTSLSLKAVTSGNGRLVAGGDTASVFFSTDGGANWFATPSKPFTELAKVQGLAFNPNAQRFAAVASVLNISYASNTLPSWVAAATPNSVLIESFRGVTALAGTGFAACGLRGDIRISQDSGATWNVSRPFNGGEPDLFGITTGGGQIVSVGAAGRVMVSADAGANWSTNSAATPIGTINNAVTYAGNEFIVVGEGGRILTGTNAIASHWTTNATVGGNLRGVAFASSGILAGVALAVGDNGEVILGGTRPSQPNSPVHQTICAGANNLPLAVSVTGGANHPAGTQTVDWYSAASGGVLLLAGNLNFVPADSVPASPNAPSNNVYYAEQRDLRTGLVSSNRIAVTNTVFPNTVVVSAPSNATNCPGENAAFSVAATGFDLAYQWRSNGVNLVESGKYVGVTSTTLQVNNVNNNDGATYSVVVSGYCNNVTNSATLTVLTNVSAIGPVAQIACPGDSASFNTAAAGSGPFSFQWRTNGVALVESGKYAGVTSAALQINNVNSNDAVTYSVVVSGICTSVTNNALLTVRTNVSAVGPVAQTNCPGTTATFSTVAAGTGPFSYQWRTNGVNLSNNSKYSGVTTATLQISNVSSNEAGNYSVVVGGFCTSVTNSASLTIAECGQLTINRQGANNVVLHWLGNLALESATNLNTPVQWVHLTNGFAGITNRWTNLILPAPTNHFFRLNTNSP